MISVQILFYWTKHHMMFQVLFIFKKGIVERCKLIAESPIGYRYVKFGESCDINIIRVGGRAGKSFLSCDASKDSLTSKNKYNYFIKVDENKNLKELIEKLNSYKWPCKNTTGPRSISKTELNPILNELFNSIRVKSNSFLCPVTIC